ncbi:MAG: (2Fe-2S)-binding protein [Prolixibacteraceae bacterium]|nr:(2Fe-2S)-binding protein [Prolixibacteraceae bacterium]
MARRLVCICNFVEEKEIVDLLKKGANTTEDIQGISRAGTTCGRCLPEIDQIVGEFKKTEPKDPQKKLDFGLQ